MPSAKASALEGFNKKFNSSTTLKNLLTGGFWTGEVPEGNDLPYGQMEIVGSSFEWTFETVYIEETVLNIHVYALGAESLNDILSAFQDTYNWQDLPLDNAETVSVECTHQSFKSLDLRDKESNLIFCGTLTYLVKLFHS